MVDQKRQVICFAILALGAGLPIGGCTKFSPAFRANSDSSGATTLATGLATFADPPLSARQDVLYTYTPLPNPPSGVTFSVTGAPSWATLDTVKGILSGYPDAPGTFSGIQITATNTASGKTVGNPFTITVAGDPLVAQSWHLNNTGQSGFGRLSGTAGEDSKIQEAIRSGYTGKGVKIGISDTGMEITHEDLQANVMTSLCKNYNLPAPYYGDPGVASFSLEDHGTMVSGIVGAVGWNGIGTRGVAPNASIAAFNYLNVDDQATVALDQIDGPYDIFNESYYYSGPGPYIETDDYLAKLAAGTTNLRGGKGAIYVHCAGNDFQYFEGNGVYVSPNEENPSGPLIFRSSPSNTDADNASPYIISVGAVNAAGFKSSYSSMGSNLWISAAGGEFAYISDAAAGACPFTNAALPANSPYFMPAIVTTDRTGCNVGLALNPALDPSQPPGSLPANPFEFAVPQSSLNPTCNYTSTMNGTSSATPNTVGVIALMLEANPNLTWRDVKHILASTAQKIDPDRSPTKALPWDWCSAPSQMPFPWDRPGHLAPAWVTNAAGFNFNNWYGFGRLDANAAVTMAKTYGLNLGTMTMTHFDRPTNVKIPPSDPDLTKPPSYVIDTYGVTLNGKIDAVQLRVAIQVLPPSIPGNIGIELTSPSKTTSVVLNAYNSWSNENSLSTESPMLTNAFYGESPQGTWTIKVFNVDVSTPAVPAVMSDWQLDIWSH